MVRLVLKAFLNLAFIFMDENKTAEMPSLCNSLLLTRLDIDSFSKTAVLLSISNYQGDLAETATIYGAATF